MRRFLIIAVLFTGACGGRPPTTHFYRLVAPPEPEEPARGPVLAIGEMEVDATYEGDRIVYRQSPYRVSRYYYHRWSAPTGRLVADYLRLAYRRTGLFERVEEEAGPETPAVLEGRLVAFEEVDESEARWIGRVEIELRLTDAESGEVLWQDRFESSKPLEQRHPVGLARALSLALAEVVERSAPAIAKAAARAQG